MRVKKIAVVLRKNGFFHLENRKIKALYPKDGYGVLVFLENSPIDKDFEACVWVPTAEDLERIRAALDKSDDLTHKMLGHGWSGKRPYWKLQDFM